MLTLVLYCIQEKNAKRMEMPMKKPQYKPYLYGMLAGFGAISLSVLFFFALYRIQTLGEVVDKIVRILTLIHFHALTALSMLTTAMSRFVSFS